MPGVPRGISNITHPCSHTVRPQTVSTCSLQKQLGDAKITGAALTRTQERSLKTGPKFQEQNRKGDVYRFCVQNDI